ncbi:MAG: penicillin-binding protein 2 [Bacilli bacterium]|nr:penicillin-binding protein 2 [Bacilli bacterium]
MIKRINFLGMVIIFVFFIILIYLFNLIILNGDYYTEKLNSLTNNVILGESTPRGRIYDRNMNLLVDNKSVPVIYYQNIFELDDYEEIEYVYKIVDIIDVDYSRVDVMDIKNFIIDRDKEKLNDRIYSSEWELYNNRKISDNDIYNLKLERIDLDEINALDEKDLEASYIYSLMDNGYYYEQKIIKDKNITDKEIAYIAENYSELGGFGVKYNWERVYLYGDTFRSLLGNISKISKEDKDYYLNLGYSLNDVVGSSYIEKQYENILKGEKAKYEIVNKKLKLLDDGKRGNDIVLSIDINLQIEVEKVIEEELLNAKSYGATNYYDHAYVVIQEPNTGEVLAISGKQIVKDGKKYKFYDYTHNILTDTFVVGSVVKGASMSVGYKNEAIKIGEYMYDDCIKIYSKPKKCSWSKLGKINDIDALAYSSNIYQFKTAMRVSGFDYSYNKKFSVKNDVFSLYRDMFKEYGLGVKTGIDLPNESSGTVGRDYSSDLLLNYTIGQYDTYSVLQLSQYITTIASDGKRIKPHLLKGYYLDNNFIETEIEILNVLSLDDMYLKRIQKGFRAVMDYGLGKNYMGKVSMPAGKTGTSQTFIDIDNDGVSNDATLTNTFVGYAPFENPKMTIAVVSPNIVYLDGYTSSRSYANKRITRRISEKFFEMYEN